MGIIDKTMRAAHNLFNKHVYKPWKVNIYRCSCGALAGLVKEDINGTVGTTPLEELMSLNRDALYTIYQVKELDQKIKAEVTDYLVEAGWFDSNIKLMVLQELRGARKLPSMEDIMGG